MGQRLEIVDMRIRRGVCEGRVRGGGDGAPELRFEAGETVLAAPRVSADAEGWVFALELPGALLDEGARSVLIFDAAADVQIGQFALSVGEALAEDLRAQVAQLRAELDLLKAAFRREMRGGG